MRTTVTAVQTMLVEEYSANGSRFVMYGGNSWPVGSGRHFLHLGILQDNASLGYWGNVLSEEGVRECVDLITDEGAIIPIAHYLSRFYCFFDASGNMYALMCYRLAYFSDCILLYCWIKDTINPVIRQAIMDAIDYNIVPNNLSSTVTDGLSKYKLSYSGIAEKLW